MLFQPSALTGGVFLLLILSRSIEAFALCLAGALGSTACAFFLERSRRDYFEGLGGFNGGLLGLALGTFYPFGAGLLSLAFAGGGLAGLVRAGLSKILPVPPFTAPFVVLGWLSLVLAGASEAPDPGSTGAAAGTGYALLTNASQVLFLQDPWSGGLVLVAVALHSRAAAMWVGVASLVAWLTAAALALPAGPTAAGLLGYNALILAAALQHRKTPAVLVVVGTVMSVLLSYAFLEAGLAPLSGPFVASAWVVIAVERNLARRSGR